ncbi:MAG: cytochrome b [Gammaproteobacteria bacterium]|nr:cytochrome b [Gammaproteobacteria bacterium]MDP6615979.1 cytochrome b [Gammaproteobacteria bacterium]MDP6694894.1 cytochrome b [Gammaproteobacteria bacterium]
MGVRNTVSQWGRVSRAFHWAMLAMIAVQIPVGFWMVEVYEVYTETYADDTWVMYTSRIHHTMGLLVLGMAFARLGWRVSNPTPDLPPALAAYTRWLVRVTHIVLYALILIYPLSGWASLSAYEGEFPIFFLFWDDMPRIVPQVKEGATFTYEFFAEIHRYCWKAGAGILGLHVLGALWHHYVARDGVLLRMWRGS